VFFSEKPIGCGAQMALLQNAKRQFPKRELPPVVLFSSLVMKLNTHFLRCVTVLKCVD